MLLVCFLNRKRVSSLLPFSCHHDDVFCIFAVEEVRNSSSFELLFKLRLLFIIMLKTRAISINKEKVGPCVCVCGDARKRKRENGASCYIPPFDIWNGGVWLAI